MKQFLALLPICILLLKSSPAFSAVASDYYLPPLTIGNYDSLYTPGTGTYSGRTIRHFIVGTDIIAGKQYFKEIGAEYADPGQAWTSDTFEIFWLRKDSVGNVVMGAIALSGSTNIDSATIMSGVIFPNEFLTKGYSRSFPYGNQTMQDSVISITETVTVPAGSFTNCIEICSSHFDSTGAVVQRDYDYYAYGIGQVKSVRTIPASQACTESLVAYKSQSTKVNKYKTGLQAFSLSLNHPNPFNPLSSDISFTLPSNSWVTFKVFDLCGREVATLLNNEKMSAGAHTLHWNTSVISSGAYLYRLQAGSSIIIAK